MESLKQLQHLVLSNNASERSYQTLIRMLRSQVIAYESQLIKVLTFQRKAERTIHDSVNPPRVTKTEVAQKWDMLASNPFGYAQVHCSGLLFSYSFVYFMRKCTAFKNLILFLRKHPFLLSRAFAILCGANVPKELSVFIANKELQKCNDHIAFFNSQAVESDCAFSFHLRVALASCAVRDIFGGRVTDIL
jgi:hypothetical protein